MHVVSAWFPAVSCTSLTVLALGYRRGHSHGRYERSNRRRERSGIWEHRGRDGLLQTLVSERRRVDDAAVSAHGLGELQSQFPDAVGNIVINIVV